MHLEDWSSETEPKLHQSEEMDRQGKNTNQPTKSNMMQTKTSDATTARPEHSSIDEA